MDILTLGPKDLAIVVLGAIVAASAVGLWFRKDTKWEARQKAAIKVSNILERKGLKIIPSILIDFAVKDISGMVGKIVHAAEMLLDPKMAEAEFDQVFENMLEARIKNPATRGALVEQVERLVAAQGQLAKSSGSQANGDAADSARP